MFDYIKSFFCKRKEESRPRRPSLSEMSEEDKKKSTYGIFFSIIEGVRISMATLLSIFVPQWCEDTQTTCTIQQNFSDLTPFNVFVIVFNFVSLLIFIKLTYIINDREIYFRGKLEESRDHPYNSFADNLQSHPDIVNDVKKYNLKLGKWSKRTLISYIANVIFSCVLIFYYFYDGFRSVTTLVANVLLVSGKLHSITNIYKDCIGDKPLALSILDTQQVSYNIIDPLYSKSLIQLTTIKEVKEEEKKEEVFKVNVSPN
jgi:hypothetical protein